LLYALILGHGGTYGTIVEVAAIVSVIGLFGAVRLRQRNARRDDTR